MWGGHLVKGYLDIIWQGKNIWSWTISTIGAKGGQWEIILKKSLTKHFQLLAWCVRRNFWMCHKALLCRYMHKSWITRYWQDGNRCGQVSTWVWRGPHSLHIMDKKRVGHNRHFLRLSIYWAFWKQNSHLWC